jgi:cytochrome b6
MSQWIHSVTHALHLEGVLAALKTKPVTHHRHSIWYYFGGLTLFFLILQFISGILLLFYYVPSADSAHESVKRIMTEVPFGWLIRSVHSWGANVFIAMMLIHMFSTFFLRSYRHPRELMWLTGIVLLLLALGFGFTGYLLPWDETAFFATQIGAETPAEVPIIGEFVSLLIKGAREVGGATLTRMFALHVGIFPLITMLVMLAHITMIMLFGVSTPKSAVVRSQEKYFSSYLPKEVAVWLIGFAVFIVIASLYPWELGRGYDLAHPSEPPENVHPEWYFMFLFQTLRLMPEWMAFIGFGLFLLFWTVAPFLDKKANSKVHTIIGCVILLVVVAMTVMAYADLGPAGSGKGVLRVEGDSDVLNAIWFFAVLTVFLAFVILLWRKRRNTQLAYERAGSERPPV